MKTRLFSAMILALPMLAYAQQSATVPTVLRDKKGIIRAMEFNEPDGTKSISGQEFMKEYLQVTANDAFVKANDKQRRPDHVNEHYDQFYSGVKVDGGGYNFHYKAGKMYYAHGHFVKLDNFDVVPAITAEKARDVLAAYKKIPISAVNDFTSELLIKEIASLDSAVNLVFKIYLRSSHPANDEIGYVQAKTGRLVMTEPIFTHAAPVTKSEKPTRSSGPLKKTLPNIGLLTPATGTFATRYSGSRTASTDNDAGSFRLLDETRGATIHTWNLQNTTNFSTRAELTDNDNNWTTAEHSANEDDMGLDVHWALQQIYDRLNTAHGVNSFDDPATGAGFPIDAHIRYGSSSSDRDNAGWDPVNNRLVYGDGDVLFRPVAALDAVAHEYGHGITDFQIGWAGTGDQGAFNEGMSDIWGVIMQHRITGGNIWQIGEQLTINNPCLRDLQNTNLTNVLQPMSDTFGSTQYNSATNIYVRSGVLSHWAYLLANGGSGTNGVSSTYNVYGVGIDQLENLIVQAVFGNFLDNTTTYAEVRTGMVNAARALCGNQNGVLVQQVENAWQAVNVGTASQSSISGAAPLCTSSTYSITNLPEGSTVSWSSSNTGGVTINSSGDATRVNNYNGYITFTATISDECGNFTLTKTVYVGPPPFAYVAVNGQPTSNATVCVNNFASVEAQPFDATASYAWSLSSSGNAYLTNYYNANTAFNAYSADCYGLTLQISNACGTIQAGLTICAQDCFARYTVQPNPAKDYLAVEFEKVDNAEALPDEIVLLSESSMKPVKTVNVQDVYSQKTFSNGNQIQIDVRDLPRGTYYLHINNSRRKDKEVDAIRILLE